MCKKIEGLIFLQYKVYYKIKLFLSYCHIKIDNKYSE